MKKIKVNENDQSFENKYTFADSVDRLKLMGGKIVKKGKLIFVLGGFIGYSVFSTKYVYSAKEYFGTVYEAKDDISLQNDMFITNYNTKGILVTNMISSIESNYRFEENNLCDNEGNIISLKDVDKPVCVINCNISNEILQNMELSSSLTKEVRFEGISIEDTFIQYLPSTVEKLSLNFCYYITNLNDLPKQCPNITKLTLKANPSLSDFSFIYQMPNLKEVYITDSAYITKELLDYLRNNNVATNVTAQDIFNSKKMDEIVDAIITPEMSDREKIQAVCLYVLDNVEYDVSQVKESNASPLGCVLEDGKGVCASYAYLTNILLNKAGISSFETVNDDHGWNTIKLDDKYYYIDTTNMDTSFYNFLLRTLNITNYYMIDTENTLGTAMSKPTDDATIIPISLIQDIQEGRSNKDIFEKYGNRIGTYGISLACVLLGVATTLGFYAKKNLRNLKRENGFIVLDNQKIIENPNFRYNKLYGKSPAYWFKIYRNEYFFKECIDYDEEPYIELFSSLIAEALGIPNVHYDLAMYNSKKGVLSANYNPDHEKEITIRDILMDFYDNVAHQSTMYPSSIEGFYNLEMIWNALEYYYKGHKNCQTIVAELMDDIVDSLLLQFLLGNEDFNSTNLTIIEADEPYLAPNYNYGFSRAHHHNNLEFSIQVFPYDTYKDSKERIKQFLSVSDSEYFERLREMVELLPNIDSIFKKAERRIKTKIPSEIKEKYKVWYEHNRKLLNEVVNDNNLKR